MKYKNYFWLITLLFFAALNFNLFVKPYSIVCGGTAGLAIIINYLTNLNISLIILIINFIMFILSIVFLDKKITISLIISTFIYPIFIQLTKNISLFINNIILNIIIVGIVSGITNGLIYKLNFSASGISILGLLFNKYFSYKIGTINLIINFFIMFLNFILFGFNNFLYSIIVIIINSLIINLILYSKK